MSETQKEYETDVEPTPGPWQADVDHQPNDTPLILAHTKPKGQVHIVAEANQNGLLEGDWKANARLIAAAGSAAQEAKEMGYDPQKAVEATKKMLMALENIRHGAKPNSHLERLAERALASAEGSEK